MRRPFTTAAATLNIISARCNTAWKNILKGATKSVIKFNTVAFNIPLHLEDVLDLYLLERLDSTRAMQINKHQAKQKGEPKFSVK